MNSKTVFGALLLSAALCAQGFAFEFLEAVVGRMRWLRRL